MKFSTLALALTATSAFAAPTEQLYTIEIAPGETRRVSESEKWALKATGTHFMDITDYSELHEHSKKRQVAAVTFPTVMTQSAAVKPLLTKLSKANLQTNLITFTTFTNRYYKATYGKQSSDWLLKTVQDVISASNATEASAAQFAHTWTQSSVIATIPGKTSNIIVIGAHQDSVNLNSPSTGRAPGADDDGSGTVTILDAMRVLLSDPKIASGQQQNTIEFHWYSAEEGGLLGSQAIFTNYKAQGKVVKAMLQQDMTGYVAGTVNAGQTISVGVITDYVDVGLSEFIKKVVTAYCAIPFVATKCGYACSDHASATKAGYPSAFVIESAFENTSKLIHTTGDTLSTVDYDHMIEHAKMTVGFGYELAFTTL
ncbi:Zn-dependent exopeptidase [Pleomassaria siparia CBS 279.74]|uniref:Peptide hydrolase n=1 Tax=Pleomassaria siparia CBS 279.74 TaxID=1314801 RepID=A0A6G1JRY1_9PLEO|nr:Zn-dependent exopeptidase [Pleomassaria siparia CBS 279.74]